MTTYIKYEIVLTEEILKIVKTANNPNNEQQYDNSREEFEYASERMLDVFDNLNTLMRHLETEFCELTSQSSVDDKFELEINLDTNIPIIPELLFDFCSKNSHDDVRIYSYNIGQSKMITQKVSYLETQNAMLVKELEIKKLIIQEYEKQLRYWEMQH